MYIFHNFKESAQLSHPNDYYIDFFFRRDQVPLYIKDKIYFNKKNCKNTYDFATGLQIFSTILYVEMKEIKGFCHVVNSLTPPPPMILTWTGISVTGLGLSS